MMNSADGGRDGGAARCRFERQYRAELDWHNRAEGRFGFPVEHEASKWRRPLKQAVDFPAGRQRDRSDQAHF